MTNDSAAAPLYFGNDDQQTRVIEAIEADIKAGKNRLHLVCGGPASGKSKAMKMLRKELGSDFIRLVQPSQIEDGAIPGTIPQALAALLRDMNEGNGAYVQHYVYKAKERRNGKDFFVVTADGETPLTDPDTKNLLHRAAALVADRDKNCELLWVADCPVLQQAIPIFKPSIGAATQRKEHTAALKQLKHDSAKQVTAHDLSYDLPTIREALWKAIEEGGQGFVQQFAETTTHKTVDKDNRAQWEKVCEAALAGDREQYDSAFRVLATGAKQARGRTAA